MERERKKRCVGEYKVSINVIAVNGPKHSESAKTQDVPLIHHSTDSVHLWQISAILFTSPSYWLQGSSTIPAPNPVHQSEEWRRAPF